MGTINPRASVRGIVKEVTAGTLVAPSAGSEFVPLRPGKSFSSTPEKLESDELINDIGASKSSVGKETIELGHPAYFKSSEVVATAPDADYLYEAALGGKSVASTEYDTIAASTTTLIKVGAAEGATFEVGEALMIKDSTNGYSLRNISSITGDDLTLNFALNVAPASAVNLGRAVLYKAGASGHPSLSVWDFEGNGGLLQSCAGARVSGMDITLDANAQAEIEFKLAASAYFVNPVEVTASTDTLDWLDTSGTYAVTLENKFYKSAIEFADAVAQAMNDSASTGTFVVEYLEASGKYKLTASGVATFSLLFNTGINTAQSIATKLGFTTAADSTGALNYTGANAITLSAGFTPSYDNASNITVKNAEFLLGDQDNNICLCASSIKIALANTLEDVDCLCAESGVQEKQITKREVTMTATVPLSQYQLEIFNNVIANKTISAMVNIGPKSGGNWVAGKACNIYLGNCVVNSAPVSGETILIAELSITGFVTTSKKDLYINFI